MSLRRERDDGASAARIRLSVVARAPSKAMLHHRIRTPRQAYLKPSRVQRIISFVLDSPPQNWTLGVKEETVFIFLFHFMIIFQNILTKIAV